MTQTTQQGGRCARCAHWKHTDSTDTVFYGECQRFSIVIVAETSLIQDDPSGTYGERPVTYASFGCVEWASKVVVETLDK